MSFGIHYKADSDGGGTRVGTNASQYVWMGLWFAAYAADRRPEANRVCAWIGNGWGHERAGSRSHPGRAFYTGPDGPPRIERNRPCTVQPWIDFNFADTAGGADEGTALCAQDYTIRLGLKMKAVTDPVLADLVALYLACCDPADYSGTLDPDLTARLAVIFTDLAPKTVESCWHETMVRTVEVFTGAAAHRVGVSYG